MKRREHIRLLSLAIGSFGFIGYTNFDNNKNNKTMKSITKSVHHIGIPISNLEKSLRFYEDFLGGEVLFINEMVGEGFSDGVNVLKAECKFAMLQIGNTIIELIEYTNPLGESYTQNNNDLGAIHIAFEVSNIHQVHKELKEKGVEFNAPPYTFEKEDKAENVVGATFAYFKDPDGIQLEIFEAAK